MAYTCAVGREQDSPDSAASVHCNSICTEVVGCELKKQESMNSLNRVYVVACIALQTVIAWIGYLYTSAAMSSDTAPLDCNKESML